MFSIICSEPGSPEVMQWGHSPVPDISGDEVLIQVAAAGVNRADCLQRQGRYPPPEGVSATLGLECAGVVVAKGSRVTEWTEGDRVCALLSGGGYAQYVAVPQGQVLPIPDGLSWAGAAALPEAIVTVWANVFEDGKLKPEETLLVHGGSSGIGTTAIQMVRLSGAGVMVTAGNDEKCAACDRLGASLSINYKAHDYVDAVARATKGCGVDIVLDMLGGEYVGRNLLTLAPLGRHISIATQHGKTAAVDMRLVMQKRLTLTGSTLRGRSPAEKARLVARVRDKIWPWVTNGSFKPLIYKEVSIKNASGAHKMMESGQHIGKIVLEVQPDL